MASKKRPWRRSTVSGRPTMKLARGASRCPFRDPNTTTDANLSHLIFHFIAMPALRRSRLPRAGPASGNASRIHSTSRRFHAPGSQRRRRSDRRTSRAAAAAWPGADALQRSGRDAVTGDRTPAGAGRAAARGRHRARYRPGLAGPAARRTQCRPTRIAPAAGAGRSCWRVDRTGPGTAARALARATPRLAIASAIAAAGGAGDGTRAGDARRCGDHAARRVDRGSGRAAGGERGRPGAAGGQPRGRRSGDLPDRRTRGAVRGAALLRSRRAASGPCWDSAGISRPWRAGRRPRSPRDPASRRATPHGRSGWQRWS